MSNAPPQKIALLPVGKLHLALSAICIVLTVVLYLKGGATNPFVSLYLVPIAISAATLSIRFTVFLTAICLLAYSLLMFYYQPLQFLSPQDEMIMSQVTLHGDEHQMHMLANEGPNWHVVGMWLNFGLSALLITWFVTRMAHNLRIKAAELSAVREKQLRDEQLLGIATLAAGTLHELGTPLATMALLAEDLTNNTKNNPELAEDAKLLAEQIVRCKQILQNLSRAAEQPSGQLQRMAINDYLEGVLSHWQLLKPGIPVQKYLKLMPVFIRVDNTLEQALINLLNNAAEASSKRIEIYILENKSTRHINICIRDYGAGISPDFEKPGKPFVSTRGQGRGLGLFLSNAAIERLGGRVTLESQPEGGTLATIILPCES